MNTTTSSASTSDSSTTHSIFIPIALMPALPSNTPHSPTVLEPITTATTGNQNKPLDTKDTQPSGPPFSRKQSTAYHNSNHLQRDPQSAIINTPTVALFTTNSQDPNNKYRHSQEMNTTTNTTTTNTSDIVSISLASLALQREVDACIKKSQMACQQEDLDKENNSPPSITAQLHFTSPTNAGEAWGISLRGNSLPALEAIKSDLMRSPALRLFSPNHTLLPEADLLQEVYLDESVDVDDVLQVGGDSTLKATFDCSPLGVNLVLGPKHALLYPLRLHDALNIQILSDSCILLSAPHAEALNTASALLQERLDRLMRALPGLPESRICVSADKYDWMMLSGSMSRFQESLWRYGVHLRRSGDYWTLQGLSGSLLRRCVDRLQELLTRNQSLSVTFACRDDLRDYPATLQETLESLAHAHNCTAKHTGSACQMRVDFTGEGDDLVALLCRIESLKLATFSPDIRPLEQSLKIQLPATIRDFISGKKEGKLTRIMKESGAMVGLSEELDPGCLDSMFVDLRVICTGSATQGRLVMAQQLLLGELPAELSFHVPETHHKRMIGHGGKAIQRIMKKWGVYVKFLNHFEAHQTFDLADPFVSAAANTTPLLLDNVIVRTPAKNAPALTAIKGEIFALEDSLSGALESLQAPPVTRISIPAAQIAVLKQLSMPSGVKAALQGDTLWLEGPKDRLAGVVDQYARLSTPPVGTNNCTASTAVEEAFRHFPSALFVQSHSRSLSASGSPLLMSSSAASWSASAANSPAPSASSSVAMNSLSASPSLLPVGSKESVAVMEAGEAGSSGDEIDDMIALVQRRQMYCA